MTDAKKNEEVQVIGLDDEVPANFTGVQKGEIQVRNDYDEYRYDYDYDDVSREIPYVNGKINGVVKETRENIFYLKDWDEETRGPLYTRETPYLNGERNGIEREYREDELIRETPYVNDEKHGIEKEYSGLGKISRITPYSHGEIHGIVEEPGYRKTQYNHGVLNGVDEVGKCERTTYIDGKKISEEKDGKITYNDGRRRNLSENEKGEVSVYDQIAAAKKRMKKHMENPKAVKAETEEIRAGVVAADKIAEKQIFGEEKRTITPQIAKEIRDKMLADRKQNS